MTGRVCSKSRVWWLNVAAIISTPSLVSCGDEDRMVVVSCSAPPAEGVSLDAEESGQKSERLAYLNTRGFLPGTVLRLNGSSVGSARGSGSAVYILRTTKGDFLPPQREQFLRRIASANFRFHLDKDVEQALTPLHIDWKEKITRRTDLWMTAERMALRDPIALLNADHDALAMLERDEGHPHFVLVSAVSYGTGVGLVYLISARSLGLNLIAVPDFYLHLRYACPVVSDMNARASLPGAKVPILYFYVGMKLNRASGVVGLDDTPLDMNTFDIKP